MRQSAAGVTAGASIANAPLPCSNLRVHSALKIELAKQYLAGRGVEFGALHSPLPLDAGQASVQYVDRLSKAEALKKFPELQALADGIVPVDFLLDINSGDFDSLKPHGFDFYIANDVIEHLTNPIGFLEKTYRAMKPGAVLFLTVPDKEYSFDKPRALTPLEHHWVDYAKEETEISLEHLNDFLLNISKDHIEPRRRRKMYFGKSVPWNPLRRRRIYALHRERSIHVHVWNQESFDTFLGDVLELLHLRLTTVAKRTSVETQGQMIYVLRKEAGPADASPC